MQHQTIRMYLGHDSKRERTVSENNLRGFLVTVSGSFPGFTVYKSFGYWEGNAEPCTVVEIMSDAELALPMVRSLARSYARLFEQDCVMVTSSLATDGPEFVGAE